MHIIKSRINPPQSRTTDVKRDALVSTLHKALAHTPCVLLSAPAGSGKTTILAQWTKATDYSVAWLQIDRDHQRLAVFAAYLYAALQPILRQTQTISSNVLHDGYDFWPEQLVQFLETVQTPFAIILDDFHLIEDEAIHTVVYTLINQMPEHGHLIVSTRVDPSLPLAQLRAKGLLSEFRLDALRFSADEALSLLEKTTGERINHIQARRLNDRVEGWVTGLQLAGLSLKQKLDVARFIDMFTGTHRHIFDYLTEEILRRQSDDVQTFLSQIAILDEFNSELTQAVAGVESAPILRYLDDSNLFIVALDEQRNWYRFHHLFRDVLLHQLQLQMEDQIDVLHHKAAIWYHHNEMSDQALKHCFVAENYAFASEIIQQVALEMFTTGRITQLRRWIEQLPQKHMRSNLRVCLTYGWTLRFIRDAQGVRQIIDMAERLLEDEQDAMERAQAEIDIAGLRVFLAYITLDDACVMEQIARVEQAPTENLLSVVLSRMALAGVHQRHYRVSDALAIYKDIYHDRRLPTALRQLVISDLGVTYFNNGHLRQSEQIYQDSIISEGQEVPFHAVSLYGLSRIHFEWNQIDQAKSEIERAIQLATAGGIETILAVGYAHQAIISVALKDWDRAHDVLTTYEMLISRWQSAHIHQQRLAALRAFVLLQQGLIAPVIDWMTDHNYTITDNWNGQTALVYDVLVQALFVLNRQDESLELLQRLIAVDQQAGNQGRLVRLYARYAAYQHQLGDTENALASLELALQYGQPDGYVRSFLNVGAPLYTLLKIALARGMNAVYIRHLLTQADELTDLPPTDILSPREVEVLCLLGEGCSNGEIAHRLFIAESTVKRHLINIYHKLNVHNRTEAIVRARELALL